MEKIHENLCFDVAFLYQNIAACLYACNFTSLRNKGGSIANPHIASAHTHTHTHMRTYTFLYMYMCVFYQLWWLL